MLHSKVAAGGRFARYAGAAVGQIHGVQHIVDVVQIVQGRNLGFTFFHTTGTRLYVPLIADPPGILQLQTAFQMTRESLVLHD